MKICDPFAFFQFLSLFVIHLAVNKQKNCEGAFFNKPAELWIMGYRISILAAIWARGVSCHNVKVL